MKRRNFISGVATSAVALSSSSNLLASTSADVKKPYQKGTSPWPICLDTATIMPATLEDKIKIAAKAGYDAIEPWDGEVEKYEKAGGNLKDLGKKIKDLGLFVLSTSTLPSPQAVSPCVRHLPTLPPAAPPQDP